MDQELQRKIFSHHKSIFAHTDRDFKSMSFTTGVQVAVWRPPVRLSKWNPVNSSVGCGRLNGTDHALGKTPGMGWEMSFKHKLLNLRDFFYCWSDWGQRKSIREKYILEIVLLGRFFE